METSHAGAADTRSWFERSQSRLWRGLRLACSVDTGSASTAADADAAGSHDKAQQNEDDASEECPFKYGHDANDDEDGGGDTEKCGHHVTPRC